MYDLIKSFQVVGYVSALEKRPEVWIIIIQICNNTKKYWGTSILFRIKRKNSFCYLRYAALLDMIQPQTLGA